jgi:hypothetical protein
MFAEKADAAGGDASSGDSDGEIAFCNSHSLPFAHCNRLFSPGDAQGVAQASKKKRNK